MKRPLPDKRKQILIELQRKHNLINSARRRRRRKTRRKLHTFLCFSLPGQVFRCKLGEIEWETELNLIWQLRKSNLFYFSYNNTRRFGKKIMIHLGWTVNVMSYPLGWVFRTFVSNWTKTKPIYTGLTSVSFSQTGLDSRHTSSTKLDVSNCN